MKLLIVTQKVDRDDAVLGFFHAWIREFAAQCDVVTVIALGVGSYDLPSNVRIYSLGKEHGISRTKYLIRFYRYLLRERANYDTVFVHMNPIYVMLGGVPWKMMGKKIVLWFTHRNVNLELRIAEYFTDVIFTAANESFMLSSNKVRVVGHGIEVERFVCPAASPHTPLRILHMGRITRIKNCDTLIEAAALLQQRIPGGVRLTFAGETVTDADVVYKKELDLLIKGRGLGANVSFVPVRYEELGRVFGDADITVNLAPTGGIDKSVLSGFVSGRPTFVSNEAFTPILGEYATRLSFGYRDPADLSSKVIAFLAASDKDAVLSKLSEKVKRDFSVKHVVDSIMVTLEGRDPSLDET